MIGFKTETGIEYSPTQFNTTDATNKTGEEEEHPIQCYHLPTIFIVILCALVLEIAKLIFLLIKQYNKVKRENKINPSLTCANISTNPSNPRPALVHSRSIPEGLNVKSRTQRSLSLPMLSRRRSAEPAPSQSATTPETRNLIQKTSLVGNVIKQQCKKTSIFITVFFLSGLFVIIMQYIFPEQSTSAQIVVVRLVTYLMVVLIVAFDKDICLCFRQNVCAPM